MKSFGTWVARGFTLLVLAVVVGWSALAIHYSNLPWPMARLVLSGAFVLGSLAVLTAVRPVTPPGEGGPIQVILDLRGAGAGVSLEEIRSLLIRHPGESPVYFRVPGDNGGDATTIRARRLLVRPSEDLLAALRERVGADAVTVTVPSTAREGSGGRAEAVPF